MGFSVYEIIKLPYVESEQISTNRTDYLYIKDITGDVIGIVKNGTVVAEYEYDAWGNCTVVQDTDDIATLNSIRWKSLYYDEESKFYYINGRYYSPEIKRYISPLNPETAMTNSAQIYGLNLYLLTLTNPIEIMYNGPTSRSEIAMTYDPKALNCWERFELDWEKFWSSLVGEHLKKIIIGALFIIAGAAITAFTAGTGAGFVAAFGSALVHSLAQVGISTAISAVIGGVSSLMTGEDFLGGFIDGLADGFMWGGIFAGGAQIMSGGFKHYAQIANHFGKLSNVKKSPMFSPDRLKKPGEIANILNKGQKYYDYGGTIVRLGRYFHIDVSTKSFLHLSAFGFQHIPLGALLSGIIGGF